MGASAILLTARILPKTALPKLIETTLGHGLTPFVEVADQDELDRVDPPRGLHRRDQQQGHPRPGARRAATSTSAARCSRPRSQTGTPVPRQRQRDHRPEGRRGADRRRLQGPPDRHRAAAQRQRPGLGRRVRAPSRRARVRVARRPQRSSAMTRVARRPLRRAGAQSQPDAPALIWEGERDQLRRARRRWRRAPTRSSRRRGLPDRPPGRHPGEEVARGDRADPRLPAGRGARSCCRRSSWPRRRSAKLFAQAGASRVLDARTGRAAQSGEPARDPRTPTPRTTARRPSGRRPGGGDDIAFMLTTSGSTGLPKIVPLPAGAVDSFTDWAARAVRHRPGHERSPTTRRSTSTSACSTSGRRSSTAAAWRWSTRTGRPTARYLADLIADNEVNVLQAVPMLYRLLIDATREERRAPSRASST